MAITTDYNKEKDMNQTTSGCAACYWYWNGQCTKANECTGADYRHIIDGNEVTIGINECGSSLPDDIINYLPDDIINNLPDDIVPLHSVAPSKFHDNNINYNVKVGVFYCPICGNEIPWYEGQNTKKVRICDECKQAIAWVKEKMKEKE